MRGYLLTIWSILDPIYFRLTRLSYLSKEDKTQNIFRVRLTKYKGKLVTLSDGTQILNNDTLVKVHFHNIKMIQELKEIKSEIRKGKMIYQFALQSLPGVLNYIQNQRKHEDIKGIIGITSLNLGCEKIGFDVFPISHPLFRWIKWVSSVTIRALSSPSFNFKILSNHEPPNYLIMSKGTLSRICQQPSVESPKFYIK